MLSSSNTRLLSYIHYATILIMFVLVSVNKFVESTSFSVLRHDHIRSIEECVVGVFTTKELAVHSISAYAGTSYAGNRALIYEMLPDGNKQKRVKIYDGSFPLCAPKLSSNQEPITHVCQLKQMQERIQKLEEKLDAKCAECNRLKNDNEQMTDMIHRMQDFMQF